MRKGEFKLSIENLVLQSEDKYANDYVIIFKQSGAFAVMIDKYLFPIFDGNGKFRIPKKLISENYLEIEFLGLFQTSKKKIRLNHSISGYVTQYTTRKQQFNKEVPLVKLTKVICQIGKPVLKTKFTLNKKILSLKNKENRIQYKNIKLIDQSVSIKIKSNNLIDELKIKTYE